jgi:hypothetical protein
MIFEAVQIQWEHDNQECKTEHCLCCSGLLLCLGSNRSSSTSVRDGVWLIGWNLPDRGWECQQIARYDMKMQNSAFPASPVLIWRSVVLKSRGSAKEPAHRRRNTHTMSAICWIHGQTGQTPNLSLNLSLQATEVCWYGSACCAVVPGGFSWTAARTRSFYILVPQCCMRS